MGWIWFLLLYYLCVSCALASHRHGRDLDAENTGPLVYGEHHHHHHHHHHFNFTQIINDPNTTSLEKLNRTLQLASGVYHDTSNIDKRILERINNTVIVTSCNYGFINHLLNFKCFMDRLNMKFVVMAMDRATHVYLTQNTSILSYYMDNGQIKEVVGTSQEFRSKQFNLITAKKKEAVHYILELGYDVLFSDTDVAILRDPFPYILWDDVDYVHSLNLWCSASTAVIDMVRSKVEGNTGFYFVKSNKKTLKLWQDAFDAALKQTKLDDQAIFWHVLRTSSDPALLQLGRCRNYEGKDSVEPGVTNLYRVGADHLVTCYLDECLFSSGMLSRQWVPEMTYEMLVEVLESRNDSICALHSNYISGNRSKMDRMKEHGFWISGNKEEVIGPASGECEPFVPKNITVR